MNDGSLECGMSRTLPPCCLIKDRGRCLYCWGTVHDTTPQVQLLSSKGTTLSSSHLVSVPKREDNHSSMNIWFPFCQEQWFSNSGNCVNCVFLTSALGMQLSLRFYIPGLNSVYINGWGTHFLETARPLSWHTCNTAPQCWSPLQKNNYSITVGGIFLAF